MAKEKKYKIVRYNVDLAVRNRVVKRNCTLKDAREHCRKASTHGKNWFDGYTKQ